MLTKKPTTSSGRCLSLFECQRIALRHDRGVNIREIARHVGRSPSTVSRKPRRNARDWDDGYEPVMAHLRASEQAKRPKVGKIESPRWLPREIQGVLSALKRIADSIASKFTAWRRSCSNRLCRNDLPSALPAARRWLISLIDEEIALRSFTAVQVAP